MGHGFGKWDNQGDDLSLFHDAWGLSGEDCMAGYDLIAGGWNPLGPIHSHVVCLGRVDSKTDKRQGTQCGLTAWWPQGSETSYPVAQCSKHQCPSK